MPLLLRQQPLPDHVHSPQFNKQSANSPIDEFTLISKSAKADVHPPTGRQESGLASIGYGDYSPRAILDAWHWNTFAWPFDAAFSLSCRDDNNRQSSTNAQDRFKPIL